MKETGKIGEFNRGRARVLISGYYGFGNLGDEALLEAIIRSLRQRAPDLAITVLSADPVKTARTYEVQAVHRLNPRAVLEALRSTDLLLSGGGTLLQDKTSLRSLIYYASIVHAARRLGKAVMIYANGLGPLTTRTGRHIARRTLEIVDRITLRDELSLADMEALGARPRQPVEVTADPAFSLEPSGPDRLQHIFSAENIPEGGLIIVSLRPWGRNVGYVKEVVAGLRNFTGDRDLSVVVLPMHRQKDLEISRRVAESLGRKAIVLENAYPPRDVLALLGSATLVVAMRLHTLIMAASQGVPAAGIVYDPKVAGFLKDMGLPSAGPVEHLTATDLTLTLADLLHRRDEVSLTLQKEKDRLAGLAERNAQLALSLLEAP